MKKIPLILLLNILFITAYTQNDPLWMRYPSISPDGNTIAFSYKGDLYTVDAKGGEATLLTLHEAYDYMPVWSPDGKHIAFASNRFGNFDVYIIHSDGGEAKRLTKHSANERPSSFTNDGYNILFSAHIEDVSENVQFPSGLLSELYQVPVSGGKIKQILSTPALQASFSPGNDLILYEDVKGYEDPWRKHHTSSVTRDIWTYEVESGTHRKQSTYAGEDRSPVFSGNNEHFYYLSEELDNNFNVYRKRLNENGSQEKITSFKDHPVRFLTISKKDDLCFGWNGEIYTMRLGEEPQKVNISIHKDARSNNEHFKRFTKDATDMDVSKDGKEVVFIVRGEVYVTSVEYNTTKQITNTPEQERSVSFSPDGRSVLYASEREGSWNIYQTSLVRDEEKHFANSTLLEEIAIVNTPEETFQPLYSPDGKEVAFLEERTTLRVINLKSNNVRTILDGKYNYSYSDGDQWYQWSPDSKWFLVDFAGIGGWPGSEVGLIKADGKGELINLTNSGYSDGNAKWMMGGEMVLYFSNRHGMKSHGSWGAQSDVYGIFLTQDAWDRYRLSEEEYKLLKEEEKSKKDEGEGQAPPDQKEKGKGKKEKDNKKDKDKGEGEGPDLPESLEFDLDGIEDRKVRLSMHSAFIGDAVVDKEGTKMYYLARFEKGYDLWEQDLKKKSTKILVKLSGSGGNMEFDKDEKHLFLRSGGNMMRIGVKDKKKKNITFQAEFNWDQLAEKEYMFEHVWRQVKKKFYVPDLHMGIDKWDFYKKEYARFLPHINNNFDFAEMLSEMLGELNGSHTGSGYRYSSPEADQTAKLGIFTDPDFTGNGVKIKEIIDKGPLLKADISINEGDIIEKIDGVAITSGMNHYELLNRKAGKKVLLSVYNPDTKKRWEVIVKPISGGQHNQLLYQRWVKKMRDMTEELSDGKIGYVHVRSMADASFRVAYSEILGRNRDKEAIIVDTRFNGGGWLHDDLATLLSGKQYYQFKSRDQYLGFDPFNKWTKPSIVLMSESNYSNAHGFPYTYKALDIGETVGMPVPGTMTAVWWETLIDKTVFFGIPQVGVTDMDGNYLENMQLEPDHKVRQNPSVVITGRDEQLEKAVEVLLQ